MLYYDAAQFRFRFNKCSDFFCKITFLLIIFSPLIPKIAIFPNITVYPHEFFLAVILPFFLYSAFFKKFLFHSLWIVSFLFVLIANTINSVQSMISYLHIIKGMLYTSVFFLGYKYFALSKVKWVIFISIAAFILNDTIYLIYNHFYAEPSIWNPEGISSGLSNRFFDISTMSFGKIDKGSHAIWGGYCVLIFSFACSVYAMRLINYKLFFLTSALAVYSVALTVSREALVVLLLVAPACIYAILSTRQVHKSNLIFSLFIICILVITHVFLFNQGIPPTIEKVIYTITSFSNKGYESNLLLRGNVQKLILGNLLLNPIDAFIGYGYYSQHYLSMLRHASKVFDIAQYPTVAESAYLQFLAYGGVLSFLSFVLFTFSIFKNLIKRIKNKLIFVLLFLSLGNILASLFVGSTWISDIYCAHYFIILGMAFRYVDEKKESNENTLY